MHALKRIHRRLGEGRPPFKEFARSLAASDDTDRTAIAADWLKNKKSPPRKEITNTYRNSAKGNPRPRGRRY